MLFALFMFFLPIGVLAASVNQNCEPGTCAASSSLGPIFSSHAVDWTAIPSQGFESISGFGYRTAPLGAGVTYQGNIGSPYCSNIIEVAAVDARKYKYVTQFTASKTDRWNVAVWNKVGPDGKLGGWFGEACRSFAVEAGSTRYISFDEDSQGGWAASPSTSIPVDEHGAFASTWGEFDFGSHINSGNSGFDVSAIVAQNAGLGVQGMKICDVLTLACSSITAGAASINNAYTRENFDKGGVGGNLAPGPVRLNVTLGYS
jgi:hypothetical protein